jgi:D-3-phosphoglycerate dehydrogenase
MGQVQGLFGFFIYLMHVGDHSRNLSIGTSTRYRRLRPFNNDEIKVLVAENVHEYALKIFREAGYQVKFLSNDIAQDIRDVHAVCVRSKTVLGNELLKSAPCLLAVGCFCIGTNNVDLATAASGGIAVFNSPYSNSRSVAEMTMANIINLSRQLGDRNVEMHAGIWNKTSKDCYEIREKTLGIVGYGHIGSQLGVLAESLGMHVIFSDIVSAMPIGRARQIGNVHELVKMSDFISIHIPGCDENRNFIDDALFQSCKDGCYIINASRGDIVDLDALKNALNSGKVRGAALDVYPEEPEKNGQFDPHPIRNCKNVILTPHIGGSTEEAQEAIGIEVASAITKFIDRGTTIGCVNLPQLDLRFDFVDSLFKFRVLNFHQSVPGVLKEIMKILSCHNITKQALETRSGIGYAIVDVEAEEDVMMKVFDQIFALKESIATRLVF